MSNKSASSSRSYFGHNLMLFNRQAKKSQQKHSPNYFQKLLRPLVPINVPSIIFWDSLYSALQSHHTGESAEIARAPAHQIALERQVESNKNHILNCLTSFSDSLKAKSLAKTSELQLA
jgi:hypothetical protein